MGSGCRSGVAKTGSQKVPGRALQVMTTLEVSVHENVLAFSSLNEGRNKQQRESQEQ